VFVLFTEVLKHTTINYCPAVTYLIITTGNNSAYKLVLGTVSTLRIRHEKHVNDKFFPTCFFK